MVKKKEIRLFNPSGCLSLEAINLFHSGNLGDLELQQVKQHLTECDICSDAMEGYTILPDQSKQHHLVDSIRRKIKSRYSARSISPSVRRDRKLNPNLVYISAAASVIIIFGIYGIINTDIFRQDNLVTEQIQEKESESREILNQVDEPLSETTKEFRPAIPEKSDTFDYIAGIPEPNSPEEKIRITGIAEGDEEIIAESAKNLALISSVAEQEEPTDTMIMDREDDIGGIEAVSVTEKSMARKAASPTIAETANIEKQAKQKTEDEELSVKDLIYTDVDEAPRFVKRGYNDFEDYIQKNLVYPPKAKQDKISGEVLVQFIVDETGKVNKVIIKQGVNSLLDQEATRVITSSPKWKPGKIDGREVPVLLTYPVQFQL